MFGKKDNLIGLDIGSRTIKVAEVQHTKRGYFLKNFGMVDLPFDAISEGSIKEPEVVSETIKGLIRDLNIREQNVAVSVAGFSVIIKKISINKMSDEELSESIQWEAEQYIPFDIEDVNIDFEILGENEQNPNMMNVMLVAAKKSIIDEYIDILQMSNLNPCVIDLDVFAMQNIYELNYTSEDESVALIDIGANKMNINIIKGNISDFTRDVSIGGDQITREIASRLECTLEEAEDVKLGKNEGKLSNDEIRDITTPIISGWCSEIRQAIDFFYSTFTDETISRIVLSGGGAQTPGFLELLAHETSLDVEVCNPFNAIEINQKRLDSNYLTRIGPQATICMGLALRKVDDK
nr:type IV pilus assembly protein PilM [Desulfobacterales bacterium]